MSFLTLRLSVLCAFGSAALGACAAVSGLDALAVCQEGDCPDGGADPADGTVGADGQTVGDGRDGGGSDGARTDAGKDTGPIALPCGAAGGLVCTSPQQVCCLGANATCAASCAGGTTVTCERAQDCSSPNPDCCATFLDGGTGGTTCVGTRGQCAGLILCDPNGPNTCGGDVCNGTRTVGGQTFHYCR
jgi:hypothetical protein